MFHKNLVNRENSCFIIAEAGVNHNGELSLAKQLVRAAQEAGADAVKFQMFVPSLLATSRAKTADYQQKNFRQDQDSQVSMISKIALPLEDFIEIKNFAEDLGIEFFATFFDDLSMKEYLSLDVPLAKIPSGEITNTPYLRKVGQSFQNIIVSTGMSRLSEVEHAVEVLTESGDKNLCILHCSTEYPAPYEDVHLKAMNTISQAFGRPVGYSDHTEGIEVSVAAVALGAKVIEKHLTLDRSMAGPDHMASIEPEGFKMMVEAIRNVEQSLGRPQKVIGKSERKNMIPARKSIVAAEDIQAGATFSVSNLTTRRPGDGVSPLFWDNIIGTKAKKSYSKDSRIEF